MNFTGDLEYIATLDDRDFRRGLNGMERDTAAHVGRQKRWADEVATGFKKGFGNWEKVGRGVWAGLAASAVIAIKSVQEYSKVNSQAKDDLDAFERSSHKVWINVGRDISGLTPIATSVMEWIAKAQDKVAGFNNVFGDVIRELFTGEQNIGNGEQGTHYKKIQEGMDKEKARKDALDAAKEESDIRIAQLRHQDDLVRKLQAERDLRLHLAAIKTLDPGGDKSALEAQLQAEAELAKHPVLGGSLGLRAGFGSAAIGAFGLRDAAAAPEWFGGKLPIHHGTKAELSNNGWYWQGVTAGEMYYPRSKAMPTFGGRAYWKKKLAELRNDDAESQPELSAPGTTPGDLQKLLRQNPQLDKVIDLLNKIEENTGGGATFN